MMASAQSCLITAFFKSPTRQEDLDSTSCKNKPIPSNMKTSCAQDITSQNALPLGDHILTEGDQLHYSNHGDDQSGFSEEEDCDKSDSEREQKPFMLNLSELLSPHLSSRPTREKRGQKDIRDSFCSSESQSESEAAKPPASSNGKECSVLEVSTHWKTREDPPGIEIAPHRQCRMRKRSVEVTDTLKESSLEFSLDRFEEQNVSTFRQGKLSWDGVKKRLVVNPPPPEHCDLATAQAKLSDGGQKNRDDPDVEIVFKEESMSGHTAVRGSQRLLLWNSRKRTLVLSELSESAVVPGEEEERKEEKEVMEEVEMQPPVGLVETGKDGSIARQSVLACDSKSLKLVSSLSQELPDSQQTGPGDNSDKNDPHGEERETLSGGESTQNIKAVEIESSSDIPKLKRKRKRKRAGEARSHECDTPPQEGGSELESKVILSQQDGSFEDFVESRKRLKRRCSSRKQKENSESPSESAGITVAGDCAILLDGEEEERGAKKSRRSAAVSAEKKICLSTKRRQEGSVNGQRDPGPIPNPVSGIVTLEPKHGNEPETPAPQVQTVIDVVQLVPDTGNNEMDDSVVFISTTPPTDSPAKQPPSSSPHDSPLRANTTSLSAEWAKIFKTASALNPAKVAATTVIEVGTTEDESAPELPKRATRKRRSTPNSSPSRPSSHSPKQCKSPRHNSPHRGSPRRLPVRNSSPLKRSTTLKRHLSFSRPGNGGGTELDHAPFTGLVHVQQKNFEEKLWDLPAPNSVPVVRASLHAASRCGGETHVSTVDPIAGLGVCSTRLMVAGSSTEGDTSTPQIQLCSVEEVEHTLTAIQPLHPGEDIRTIFERYRRVTQENRQWQFDKITSANLREPGTKPLKKKRRRNSFHSPLNCSIKVRTPVEAGRVSVAYTKQSARPSLGSLKCSIRVCTSSVDNGKILVDTAAYTKPVKRRKSLRLSKGSREATPECNSNPSTTKLEAGKKDKHSQTKKERRGSSAKEISKEEKTLAQSVPCISEVWTEVYRPQCSSEVIGNKPQVHRLRTWLSLWKARCCSQREVADDDSNKKAKSQQRAVNTTRGTESMKCTSSQSHSSHGAAAKRGSVPFWVNEEDSDFLSLAHLQRRRSAPLRCRDSSDEDERGGIEGEDSLCSVFLLCGDHGCGKTAAVYACAQELGYKVFEVNSTTVRSRQNLLATLKEATLSHQVVTEARGHIDRLFGSKPTNGGRERKPVSSEGEKKVAGSKAVCPSKPASGGLFSFFKPKQEKTKEADNSEGQAKGAGGQSMSKTKLKGRGRRRSRKNSVVMVGDSSGEEAPPTATEHAQSSGSVALATASVILLEEVDILFDDDRGFWSAVYELILTTKRPIVMTCNDPRYELECDHQKLLFTHPPLPELSLHMQLLCLAHGAYLSPEAANQIAAFLQCDIRSAINCFQFWLSLLPSNHYSQQMAAGPVESIEKSTPLTASESIASELVSVESNLSASSSEQVGGRESVVLLEHLLGLSESQRECLQRVIQPETPMPQVGRDCEMGHRCTEFSCALEAVHRAGIELAHPLTTLGLPRPLTAVMEKNSTSVTQNRLNLLPQTKEGKPVDTSEHRFSCSAPWRCPRHRMSGSPKYFAMDTVSNLCDNLSFMDSITVRSCDDHVTSKLDLCTPWWKCRLETDLLDELPCEGEPGPRAAEESLGLQTSLEALSRVKYRNELEMCGVLGSEGTRPSDAYSLLASRHYCGRVEGVHSAQRACSEVFTSHWELSRVAMATDCLPVLQLVCHSENMRNATNLKRRFRHYLLSSVVDLHHLKAFPRTAAFSSDSQPP